MVRRFVGRRLSLAVLTLWVASLLIFAATEVLPGNAAQAILGRQAETDPGRLRILTRQLHLDQSVPGQYWHWFSGVLTGHLGTSLANGLPVSSLIGQKILNTGFLVAVSAAIGLPLAAGLGVAAAAMRDRWLDRVSSVGILTLVALPEFVVGIGLTVLFGTSVWRLLPPVATIAPGSPPWSDLSGLVLPVATLVLVTTPYVSRIMRGAMVEALESEYVEFATLRGESRARVVLRHALPNAVAPVFQASAISLAYLAGGAVIVEYIFAYPGIGQALVSAVANRDVPVIQFITLLLAGFYILLNLVADVATVLLTPRARAVRP
jgi:peptide/nickel transport system permease protein